jgi:hypothetical protein
MINAFDIKYLSFDGLKIDFADPKPVDRIISAVIKRIEGYLNRPLEKATYIQYGTLSGSFIPIVTPVHSAEAESYNDHLIELDKPACNVEYEGGYEELPDDILQVIFRLVVWEINKASQNQYGVMNKVVVTGSTESNIQIDQRNFAELQLESLSHYRNMQFYSYVVKK